ncbi:MAG: hypothetical protein ACNI27_16925 [Desulfovibrio sp.]
MSINPYNPLANAKVNVFQPAPKTTEAGSGTAAIETTKSSKGDRITLSAKGVQMSTALSTKSSGLKGGTMTTAADKTAEATKEASSGDMTQTLEKRIEKIKEKIKELQKKLQEIQSSSKPDELKQAEMKQIQSQISTQQNALSEANSELQKLKKTGATGGTKAQGMANSLT